MPSISLRELPTWSSNSTCVYNGEVLTIDGSLSYDSNDLFRESHIAIERGSIYGLVAPNGAGKTSLVRAIPTLPDFPTQRFNIEYLTPDMVNEESSSLTAKEYCLARIDGRVQRIGKEIEKMESQLEQFADDGDEEQIERVSNELGDLYGKQDDLSLTAQVQVEKMLTELGFGKYASMAYHKLSSGWRYKCKLISALLTQPDLLTIDEPSFLDSRSTTWLVSELQQLSKSQHSMVILISHKEALLEELCDRILYINPASKTLSVFNCSYAEFQAAHGDQLIHAKRAKESADKDDHNAKESLDKLRKQLKKREGNFKATTTKNADQRFIKGKNKEAKQKADHSAAAKVKRMKKKVDEMNELEQQMREATVPPLHLEGASGRSSGPPLITLNEVGFQYEESADVLFDYVDAQIGGTDKILLQGPNGQGKSSLVSLIVGRLEPSSGVIRRNHVGRIAYFPQNALVHIIEAYGNWTGVEFLQDRDSNLSATNARTILGKFGLKGALAARPIKTLSAGQRARMWLAREFWNVHDIHEGGTGGSGGGSKVKEKQAQAAEDESHASERPSLLILDEATENLDKETTDSLLESLDAFEAAILAISHDPYFGEHFHATQVWTLNKGRLITAYQ